MGACFAKPKTRSLLIDTLQQYSHVTCRSYPLRHPVCTAPGYIDTGDDSMMNAIQIPLVILQKGSSLASKPPSIAPTEVKRYGVRNSDARPRLNREDYCQCL